MINNKWSGVDRLVECGVSGVKNKDNNYLSLWSDSEVLLHLWSMCCSVHPQVGKQSKNNPLKSVNPTNNNNNPLCYNKQ